MPAVSLIDPSSLSKRPVRSREHLLHMLAEAAELEHNLLCSYLFAAFSLKRGLDEELDEYELPAVRRWHGALMNVCKEEMTHLAQVANLMIAVGSRPHFDRPNLPIAPGYHPARIQIALAPFDLETLEHFIYLERPGTSTMADAESFRPTEVFDRRPEHGVLMPSAPDYETIGEFYELLTTGLEELAAEIGEQMLFLGPKAYQLRPQEIGSKDLMVVDGLESARRALHFIIVQGEGAPDGSAHSHYETFSEVRREFWELKERRPSFSPARTVARNPVMRRPLAGGRIHVTHPAAAAVLDVANAVYALMVRCLTSVYDVPVDNGVLRQALLTGALGLMKLLAAVSDALTQMPAAEESGVNAGVTFTMLRSTEGLVPGVSLELVILHRFERIAAQIPHLPVASASRDDWRRQLSKAGDSLQTIVRK